MKNLSFLMLPAAIVLTMSFSTNANATIDTVLVQNFSFSPDTVNANVGDTIFWSLVGGTHTTTSTNVPSGAATWDHPFSSGATFMYVVQTAGTYNYWCNIHTTMMEAVINASAITGISAPGVANTLSVFPQSVQSELTIQWNKSKQFKNNVSIQVFDMAGKKQFQNDLKDVTADKTVINLSDLAAGSYLVNVSSKSKTETFKIVKLQ